jgi:2'-5' RNA ligase
MKPSQIKILNPVQELFFIIAPPPHIMSDVSVLKDDVQYLIGHTFEGRHSKAHISLFKYSGEYLDDMVEHVETKAAQFNAFNLFIKNLNMFRDGSQRTIYLDIINKYAVRDIFESLVKQDENYTPHITIAKTLSSEDFSTAWPHLKDLSYSQNFLCDRITVLMRGGNRWVHYKDILFGQ